jgi:hypothetical protein
MFKAGLVFVINLVGKTMSAGGLQPLQRHAEYTQVSSNALDT